MKIISFFILIPIFFINPSEVLSQPQNLNSKFDIGFELGPQFTNIYDDNSYYQTNSLTGFTAGIFGEYYFFNSMKVRIGGYFDERKYEKYINIPFVAELNNDSTGYVGTSSYYLLQVDNTLNYLTFPISLIYENGTPKFKVLIQIGMYYSLLLSAKQQGESDLYIDEKDAPHFENPEYTQGHHFTSYSGNIDNQFKSYDIGVNLYIGGNAKVRDNLSIFFAPGLAYGLTNVYADSDLKAKWKSMIRLNAGMIYSFKNKQ